MKKLGIIGGLGPMASAYFMELIVKMTDVKTDQEHLQVFLHSIPNTPDRTDYICGKSNKNPLPHLIKAGISLQQQGAEFIAIPCVTAHYFYKELKKNLAIPIIPLINNLVNEIKQKNICTVGVMATNGTLESQLLHNEFGKAGIKVVVPSKDNQELIMNMIYKQIKAGKKVDIGQFFSISDGLIESGAEKIIIACTELSLLKREYLFSNEYIDVLETLAKNSIEFSGAPLKNEYKNISTSENHVLLLNTLNGELSERK